MLLLGACARAPIKSVDQSMRLTDTPAALNDELNFENFAKFLGQNLDRLEKFRADDDTIRFGPYLIHKKEYLSEMRELQRLLEVDPSGVQFINKLRADYAFLEVYGDKKWGQVFVTGYFEPRIMGSKKKTKVFTQPLWGVPKDLVGINFGEFARTFTDLQPVYNVIVDKSRDGVLRGRLQKAKSDDERDSLIPYYAREQIDAGKSPLAGQAQVLCYVDPVDAFFLQIQGSGTVVFNDGQELRLGYAAQNGYSYQPIGKFLWDVIPKEEMTAQKIIEHLRSLGREEQQKIFNKNPSYVFFQKLSGRGITYFGAEVMEGRTIATDTRYFPKGALAFLEFEKPVFAEVSSGGTDNAAKGEVVNPKGEAVSSPEGGIAASSVPSSRFVFDQDTGGAIRGPHRVDLFWGEGEEAAKYSGALKSKGKLFYLLPKSLVLAAKSKLP